MAFIVEDGTGKKGATSYATVAYFRAYMADRGIDVTTWTDAEVQACLIKATDYIDTRWRSSLLGQRQYDEGLYSRSVFTLTDLPSAGESIVIDGEAYTFQATPSLDTDIEIGDTIEETFENLESVVLENQDSEDPVMVDCEMIDPDIWSLTIYTVRDGITTTTTCVNGSFDVATSTGYSGKRQPREFPREYLYDAQGEEVEGIPENLKAATCEYAYRSKTVTLAPDPEVDASISSISQSVGPISKSVTYSGSGLSAAIKPYPAADRLLSEYVRGGGIIRS